MISKSELNWLSVAMNNDCGEFGWQSGSVSYRVSVWFSKRQLSWHSPKRTTSSSPPCLGEGCDFPSDFANENSTGVPTWPKTHGRC
jgi:hypothetical protein